jgi:FkbM family methyltransferase
MSITPTGNPEAASPPWGTFAPKGYRRFLRGLVALGLGRGGLKRWFYRQWIKTSGNTPADIIIHGLKLRLHPYDNTTESKLLLGSRSRDHEELSFLMRHLPPGGTFVDVGANIGFYSLVATARGAARTLAVEPLPAAFERLQFNIRANDFEQRITALQAALGPERKRITITVAEGDLGSSSIVRTDIAGKAVEVAMLPLVDALSENAFTRVDGMKIDVEGMEDSVLCPFFKTAPRALWPGCVIIEDVQRGNWKQDVLVTMVEAGYRYDGRTRSNALFHLPARG